MHAHTFYTGHKKSSIYLFSNNWNLTNSFLDVDDPYGRAVLHSQNIISDTLFIYLFYGYVCVYVNTRACIV